MDISNILTQGKDVILQYFPFLASVGIFVTFWTQIKEILNKIFHLFVIEVDGRNMASCALRRYLNDKCRILKMGKYTVEGQLEYVKPLKRRIGIIYSIFNTEPQIYLLKHIPILVIKKEGENNKNRVWQGDNISLYFLRFTINPKKILKDSINYYNEELKKQNKRFFITQVYGTGNKMILKDSERLMEKENFSPGDKTLDKYFIDKPFIWNPTDLGFGNDDKENILKNYVFCENIKQLLKRVETWKTNRDWYSERGIPWRLGSLLMGKVGSGKSFAIKTICELLDLPLFIFDLQSLDNQQFIEKWIECQGHTPCAILFEDIDGVWRGRDQVQERIGPTFDCFINCIGGALPAIGVVTFITTNKPEILDNAIKRAGRCDVHVELEDMNKEDRIKLASVILKDCKSEISKVVNQTENCTVAQCVEIFSKEALKIKNGN